MHFWAESRHMVRTRWKGERVSGKKEDDVMEALLRRGHSLLRWAGSKFKVSLRGEWLKIIEEAGKTNRYVFLEDQGADWWGLRTNNWSTCVRKRQKGTNWCQTVSARYSDSQGFNAASGLLAAEENMNHELEPVMMNLPEAESSRSNQEMFTHTKASLHYPQPGFISVF